ncbi:unnamed protein product [Caenorhabditis brenneri]
MTVLWDNFKIHLSPHLFAIYTLVWTIICIIMEFSPAFRSDAYWLSYSIFGCYNLSISILFYVIVWLTSWRRFPILRVPDSEVKGVGASVFFLKLGAMFFCIGSIVLWSIEFFLAFAEDRRPWICIFRTCLYIVFHATQLVFILKSQQITIYTHRLIVYFGLSHNIAVNLWIWLSLCIAKSGISNDDVVYNITYGRQYPWVLHPTEEPVVVDLIFESKENKLRAVKLFGTTAITFLTGNVEFCLLAVGVLLSLFYTTAWSEKPMESGETDENLEQTHIKFKNENTEIAIGLGYGLLILFILSISFGDIMRDSNYPKAAGSIVGIFQLSFYTISIIACLIVFQSLFQHIMRKPNYASQGALPHEKALNVIFLLVGAAGEVIYCSVGLLGVIQGDCLENSEGLVLSTFVVRALEVLIQAVLLFYLLTQGNTIHPCVTYGKQTITFLIALNLILFGFHTLEGSIRTFGFPSKLDNTSKTLLKISLPLVVFFRFHCSVCFAEIWKIMFYDDSGTRPSSVTPSSQNSSISPQNSIYSHSEVSEPGVSPRRYAVSSLTVNPENRAAPSRQAPPSARGLLS